MRWMLVVLAVAVAGCAGAQKTDSESEAMLEVAKACEDAAAKKAATYAEPGDWTDAEAVCLRGLWLAHCVGGKASSREAASGLRTRAEEVCGPHLTARVQDAYDSGPPSLE